MIKMNKVTAKKEWVKTWSDKGIGWIQLSHENKFNPWSSGFIVAKKSRS